MPRAFPFERLVGFATELLNAAGVSDKDARTCATRLAEGDARGHRAHGLARLPAYVRRIQQGGLNPRAVPHLVTESPVSALVDGDNGLGPVVMSFATELAIAKAAKNGLAWIGIRGGNHAGAGGVYAQMLVDADLIGIVAAVANTNQVAPWGHRSTPGAESHRDRRSVRSRSADRPRHGDDDRAIRNCSTARCKR